MATYISSLSNDSYDPLVQGALDDLDDTYDLNSIILGTRKLWQMFPIKQKFYITTEFFYNNFFENR